MLSFAAGLPDVPVEFEAMIEFVRMWLIAFTQSAPRTPVGSLSAGLSPTFCSGCYYKNNKYSSWKLWNIDNIINKGEATCKPHHPGMISVRCLPHGVLRDMNICPLLWDVRIVSSLSQLWEQIGGWQPSSEGSPAVTDLPSEEHGSWGQGFRKEHGSQIRRNHSLSSMA